MISIDEQPPPDPSSSHTQKLHQQQQVSYEAFASVSDIDLLKTTDVNLEDTNNSLPSFSIRDYVFESRSKDIARNWPFSVKSLQLCLNYGVKNLLPPFQSLDSVRNYRSVSVCAVEDRSPNQETISSFDGKRNDISQWHLEEDLAHTKSNSQPIVKKCKLVMKLNLGVEPSEETAAASKVCPVCKTFSSSSNTTLNAHIDSCLSEESSMKCTADLKIKTVKHRIKHRKTRLMVDVYKTAPRCTIEELDRRNGTNWATSSSFPDQELEFQAEVKNKEPQKPTYVPEAAEHEGAVYIDKNGKKVRILSMPKVSNLDGDEARVLYKGRKGSKVVIKKKKKAYMPKNDKKNLKLSHKSKKLSKKTESDRKENVAVKECCEKEDGGAKPMKTQVNEQMDNLAITRPPWTCFKRTGAAKKRFPMYTKRKEGALLGDYSCENPISSKGSKLSSLKKSLSMPASREHNVGSKLINLKRKFSSLGKSQDTLKQKTKTEEDTSKKMSFEMTNDMEVKTKKSLTSKSSNGDSSSGGLEIASESAKTEDNIGIEPSFMGLKNSLDNQFSNMISQLDNKFDSQQQRTLDDIIMEQDSEKQGNYYDEVDPIPIPGPPGSFLPPSPGADMASEEEQPDNSSLTTMSRVQSSEDHRHHDITNQDFISGSSISTVSSPSFAKSADKLSAIFDGNSVHNNNNNNTSDLRSVDPSSKEKGPTPCCCFRKEGSFFNNVASYRQESVVSKERANEANGLRSELFPLVINHLTLPPPEMVKPPVVTPTTPVLRLMGKNLTVVNTDNEQVKPPCSSPMGQYQQPQRYRNEKHDSLFYGHPLQNHIPLISHNQNGSMSQRFNLYAPSNSKSHSDLRSANMDTTATKEIIVIDDSSDNEGHDGHHHDHMFKEPMIRTHAFSFANPYGNDSLQTSSPLQEVANDGNHGRWVSTAYYPRSFS